jgi:cyclopropane-fatty-acyl-phospholipid synthase
MAALSISTARLCRAFARAFPDRPFSVEFWDGGRVPATRAGAPTLEIRSPRAIGHLVRSPGQLGLGRAYVCGEIDVDDLDGVVRLIGRWKPRPVGPTVRARLALAALAAAGPMLPPRPPAAELRPGGRRHSRARDSRAVRHHYDVSNEFFALFLDESMTYSCALWRDGARTLEEAQEAKLELVCSKLDLRAGQRVLDVGCGWGSFALHAARHHGASVVGITLSPPQAELARARTREAGLEDSVDIRVADYRDLVGERFDAVASIGMVEHVGEQRIDEYARAVARVLEPGGRFLCHGITRVPPGEHRPSAFSQRYVFPDGQLLHPSRLLTALERAGFETLHVEALQGDYAETLRHWARRFDEHLGEAVRSGGEERARVWRLYLRAARQGFETGATTVHQVLCLRPPPDGAPAAAGATGERRELAGVAG